VWVVCCVGAREGEERTGGRGKCVNGKRMTKRVRKRVTRGESEGTRSQGGGKCQSRKSRRKGHAERRRGRGDDIRAEGPLSSEQVRAKEPRCAQKMLDTKSSEPRGVLGFCVVKTKEKGLRAPSKERERMLIIRKRRGC
jgi:hypothetical protein